MTVAALYVETNGIYYALPDVDPWDESRDARLYAGPWPVVAHPPCQRWCILAPLVESRLGDKYRVGDDGGTFEAALRSVREWGGVLEHPALTYAWARYGLPKPSRGGWQRSFFDDGWVTEVSQVAYGHAARKRTWLYYVGTPDPPALDWSEPKATAMVSDFRRKQRGVNLVPLNEGKSSYTPETFRDVLLDLARNARTQEGQIKEAA